MNEHDREIVEQERYELFAGPTYNFNFNRRQFLKAFSGGIALIVPVSNLVAHTLQQEQGESGGARGNQRIPNDIGAWIHIDEKARSRFSLAKSKSVRTFVRR